MGTKKRSKKYRQTKKGKEAKQRLNRKRYLRDDDQRASREAESEGEDDMLEHLSFMIGLSEGNPVDKEAVKELLEENRKKWRQRPLVKWLEWCKLNLRKRPP
jgi:hypothetical protein